MTGHERFRAAWIGVGFAVSAALLLRLPVHLPPHWPAAPWAVRLLLAFLLPTLAAMLWILFARLAAADPWRSSYAKFRSTWELVLDGVVVFVVGLHLTLLATLFGAGRWIGAVPPLLVGGLLVAVGNVLPRLRPNSVLGIRSRRTLADERLWARTHRLFGYYLFAWGLAVLGATLMAPAWLPALVICGAALAAITALALPRLIRAGGAPDSSPTAGLGAAPPVPPADDRRKSEP